VAMESVVPHLQAVRVVVQVRGDVARHQDHSGLSEGKARAQNGRHPPRPGNMSARG
jgi:hypothetical protein